MDANTAVSVLMDYIRENLNEKDDDIRQEHIFRERFLKRAAIIDVANEILSKPMDSPLDVLEERLLIYRLYSKNSKDDEFVNFCTPQIEVLDEVALLLV